MGFSLVSVLILSGSLNLSAIVAAQSGIIVRISAESGTPQVTAGQAVRKGQVLIRGQERTGGGGTQLCRAQGEIIARVFVRGDARVSLNAVEKWDGVLPATQVPGAALPFIGIK